MSWQLTWYNSLTSEERTITLRDVEPFLYAQTKVQFNRSIMDLLPMYEGIFLPQKFELETLTRTNPQPIENIKTLTQEDSVQTWFLQEVGGCTLGS